MFSNPSKYYSKYNKNIKAIKGSGVVTPRPPKDTSDTTGTVKETLHEDIMYMPPLYLRTWDNDEQNTNGYLNSSDYVNYVPDIDKYYYTTQQLDKVDVKKRSDFDQSDPSDPIKLPPPLVTTRPNYVKNNTSKSSSDINIDLNSINNIDGNTNSQYGIGSTDINRNWYDGRYLYTFSPTSLKTIYPWTTYNLLYPFDSSSNTLKYYQNAEISNITGNPLLRDTDPFAKEGFSSTEITTNTNNISNKTKEELDETSRNYNLLYLTILCVLIIIYFIKSNK